MSGEKVEATILTGAPGAERLREERVWIAPIMEASVQGAGFEFVTKQAYSQPIAIKVPTVWTWQVMPTEPGPLQLEFRISGQFKVEKELTLQRDLFNKTFVVAVDVNPEGFFKRNWEKLLTMAGAIITAVVGGIWAYIKWLRPTPEGATAKPATKPKRKR